MAKPYICSRYNMEQYHIKNIYTLLLSNKWNTGIILEKVP